VERATCKLGKYAMDRSNGKEKGEVGHHPAALLVCKRLENKINIIKEKT